MLVQAGRFYQRHQPEAAMVGEDDSSRCIRLDHDMVMFAASRVVGRRVVDIIAKPACALLGVYAHASTHAEMHDQGFVVVEFGKQVFGSTPKPGDAPTRETTLKALGKRYS